MSAGTWLTHTGRKPSSEIQLEPEFHVPYAAWKKSKNPATTGAMLKAIKPILDRGVNQYGGHRPGPVIRGQAKRIAIDALPSYDPTKGKLNTHLMSHLQGLQRIAGQQSQAIHVPERVVLDQQYLRDSEAELEDKLGRPPSSSQLADHTGMSLKRIAYVRQYKPGFAEGQMQGMSTLEDDESNEPAVERPEPLHAKLNFIYPDLDATDQLIVEHAFGLHGRQKLPPGRIATALNVNPSSISRRMSRISRMLNELDDAEVL
jgi:DNA-directed RNA polymerase specialized sigma subunit